MRLQLLGSTRFDGEPVGFGTRDRQLLSLLAVMVPDAVGRTVIVDELWGEAPPKNPTNAIQASVSRLRKKLGPVIELVDGGYRLRLEPEDVDLAVVDRMVEEAKRSDGRDDALSLVGDAVELLQPGLEGVTPLVERWYESIRIEAESLRAEALVATRRFTDATRVLEDLVVAHPFRESLWALLMRALYGESRQADALRAYQRASEVLAEAGITPGPDLTALEERILLQDPSLAIGRAAGVEDSLPARRTPMIGRSADSRAVHGLLASNRVVSLIGLGGIGKTTLATEVGRAYASQVWFVDLTAVSDDDEVAFAVSESVSRASVDGDPIDRIVDRLIGTAGLLILDNCEHVIEGAASTLSTLIDRLGELRVLTTSREPLRLRGEQVYPVEPLDVSADGAGVELFIARSEAVRPGVSDDADPGVIASVCALLDGVPLAIEIVASAAAAMTINQILDRLTHEESLPTAVERDRPSRHATLDAIVGWSVAQLSVEERRLFARLSVFADGATLAAVEEVCGFDPLEADRAGLILGELVRRSLVTIDTDGRYRQLWLVRRVAMQGLEDFESEEVRRRFVTWAAGQVRGISDDLRRGAGQADALALVDREAVNLRHALRSFSSDPGHLIDIAYALVWSSTRRVGGDESVRLADTVLSDLEGPLTERYVEARLGVALSDAGRERRSDHPADELVGLAEQTGSPDLVALALGIEALHRANRLEEAMTMVRDALAMTEDRWSRGVLHIIEANVVGYVEGVGAALAAAEAAVRDLEEVQDRWRTATALAVLGTIRQMTGDYDAADRSHSRVLEIADEMGLAYDRYLALVQIANTASLRGDHDRARQLAHEALGSAAAIGGGARANALNTLGRVSNAMGRFDDAHAAHTEALRIYTGLDAFAGVAHSLDNLGLVLSRTGDPEGGARRHLQAVEINARNGDPLSVAFSLEGLALSLAFRDRGDDAARLLGAAHAQRVKLGLPLPDGERRYVDAASALARESVDDFERVFSEGERADWRVLVEAVRSG